MGTISQTYSFVAGSIPTAANWNSNWTTVLGLVNGALDSANVDKTSSDAIMVVDTAQTLTAAKTFNDNVKALFGTGSDAEIYYDATNLVIEPNAVGSGVVQVNGGITVGVNDTGHDVQMFGAAAGAYLLWDESANALDVRGATAAGPGAISLETAELTVVDGDILGRIDFSAPAESSGTDAVLVGASIWAESDDTFAADNNATSLVFAAATSETAAAVMRLSKTALTPQTTDGLSLGTSALNFSDLFLDDGAVINFNSGDVTVTHSTDTLTVAGGTFATAALTATSLSVSDGNITNVGNIALDSISSDAETSIAITLGTDAADDLLVSATMLVVEGDTGNVGVGTASPAVRFHATEGVSNDWISRIESTHGSLPLGLQIFFASADPNNNVQKFLQCQSSGGVECVIYSDGDLANVDGTYGTLSDEKLKQDFGDVRSYWDDFKSLKYQKYRHKRAVAKDANAPYRLGLIAQEVEEVFPALVMETGDTETFEEEVVKDGKKIKRQNTREIGTTTKAIKSSIIDGVINSIVLQEAMARIEALEAKVA